MTTETGRTRNSLVSIIIPTYNMRQWIGEAIDSALAQTYPNCKIIVVDDGSTDGTGEYLRERYGERIRYIYQPNRGRGAARNHGLRMADGEYTQFLDADDLILPEKIASQVAFLDAHPEYAAAYCHCLVFFDEDKDHPWDWPGQKAYCSGNILEREIHEPFLLPVMILVRREWVGRVGGLDETLRSNEDWDLWLRIAHAGGQFKYLPGPALAMYRRTHWHREQPASIHLESGVVVLRKLETLIESQTDRKHLRLGHAIGKWQYGYGYALIEAGQRRAGMIEMLKSLTLNQGGLGRKLVTMSMLVSLSPAQVRGAKASLRTLLRRPPRRN